MLTSAAQLCTGAAGAGQRYCYCSTHFIPSLAHSLTPSLPHSATRYPLFGRSVSAKVSTQRTRRSQPAGNLLEHRRRGKDDDPPEMRWWDGQIDEDRGPAWHPLSKGFKDSGTTAVWVAQDAVTVLYRRHCMDSIQLTKYGNQWPHTPGAVRVLRNVQYYHAQTLPSPSPLGRRREKCREERGVDDGTAHLLLARQIAMCLPISHLRRLPSIVGGNIGLVLVPCAP